MRSYLKLTQYFIAELLQDDDSFIFVIKWIGTAQFYKIPDHLQHTVFYEYVRYVSKKADCGIRMPIFL